MPKISIVVTVYNTEKFLRECLDSILNQTYRDIEVIVVNDASPDNSQNIIDEFAKRDKRVVSVINRQNMGLIKSRLNGFKRATGELIGVVDSDDYIALDMYEIMYSKMLEDGSDIVDCVMSTIETDGHKGVYSIREKDYLLEGDEILETFFLRRGVDMTGMICSKLFKRELLKDFDIDGIYLNHFDTLHTFGIYESAKRVTIIKDELYNYRLFRDNKLSKYMSLGYFKELEFTFDYIYDYLKKDLKKQELSNYFLGAHYKLALKDLFINLVRNFEKVDKKKETFLAIDNFLNSHLESRVPKRLTKLLLGKNQEFSYIGNLSKDKGIDLLIDSFVSSKFNNCKLHILGNGSELENLKKQAKDSENIIFHGFVKDTSEFVQNSINIISFGRDKELYGKLFEFLDLSDSDTRENIVKVSAYINNINERGY